MKLNDKRKVAQLLACAARSLNDSLYLDSTSVRLGIRGKEHCRMIDLAWEQMQPAWVDAVGPEVHGTACLEAAYRLIESSPTLRREWFTSRRSHR